MKKIMHYSEEKFNGFSDDKKIRIIASFIDSVCELWTKEDDLHGADDDENRSVVSAERVRLLSNLEKCLFWLSRSDNRELKEISRSLKGIGSSSYLEFTHIVAPFVDIYGKSVKDSSLYNDSSVASNNYPLYNASQTMVKKLPLYGVLLNLRSAFNVGSIIRSGECFAVEKIYMCGYTPTPDSIKVKKTAMNTDINVFWERRGDIFELLRDLKDSGIEVIALETGKEAEPLHKSLVSKPAAIIVGNEAHGLPQEVLRKVDRILKIPLFGRKESLNVAVAFGIACHEILRQWNLLENRKEEE